MPISRDKISFWFDNVYSEDIGLKVSGFPTFFGAEKRMTKYEIPGRNGDLIIWDGSFENIEGQINCYISSENKVCEALTTVNNWLSGSGYKKLIISSEIGRYRLARISNSADINIRMGVIAPFTIIFDCKPQRFFCDEPCVTIPGDGDVIFNPTAYVARPIIRCKTKDHFDLLAEEILIGDGKVRINDSAELKKSEWIEINFDTKTVVNNLGERIPTETFDSNGLVPGNNQITTKSQAFFSEFYVEPRWWTL